MAKETISVTIGAVAVLLTLARAIFGRPLRPAWLHAPVLLLRLGAIVLVANKLYEDSVASEAVIDLDAPATL